MTCSTGGGMVTFALAVDPQMNRVMRAAVMALASEGLEDALELVADRVLRSRRLIDIDAPREGSPPVLRLKPFAELALRETFSIARSTALDSATKTRRVGETVALAGY